MDYESGKAIPNNQVLSKLERALGELMCEVISHFTPLYFHFVPAKFYNLLITVNCIF